MKYLLFPFLSLLFSTQLVAQYSGVQKTIFTKDSLFWIGYNTCDIGQMEQFVADDIEFYHDKGGVTNGKAALMESVKNNLCSNKNFRTRREALTGTVKVYELMNNSKVYGAIISGEHYFYNSYDGKPEKREGQARFAQLWILKDSSWKMTRILSYDHHDAPYQNLRQEMSSSARNLAPYAGQYTGPNSGLINAVVKETRFSLVIGEKTYALLQESETIFFVEDRDLTFTFVKNEKGQVQKLVVRENGKIVEEANKK